MEIGHLYYLKLVIYVVRFCTYLVDFGKLLGILFHSPSSNARPSDASFRNENHLSTSRIELSLPFPARNQNFILDHGPAFGFEVMNDIILQCTVR